MRRSIAGDPVDGSRTLGPGYSERGRTVRWVEQDPRGVGVLCGACGSPFLVGLVRRDVRRWGDFRPRDEKGMLRDFVWLAAYRCCPKASCRNAVPYHVQYNRHEQHTWIDLPPEVEAEIKGDDAS